VFVSSENLLVGESRLAEMFLGLAQMTPSAELENDTLAVTPATTLGD
jgi:hypothetical protein